MSPRLRSLSPVALVLLMVLGGSAWVFADRIVTSDPPTRCLPESETGAFVSVPAGQVNIGNPASPYPEEHASRSVRVSDFAISSTEVTNAEFRRFVDETRYVTVAERELDPAKHPGIPPEFLVPGAAVFVSPEEMVSLQTPSWWRFVAGANWRHPSGPESSLAGLDRHPVVQVAHEDAIAYARWAGGRLPSEAEWEYAARAARSGHAPLTVPVDAKGNPSANTWQGLFPVYNLASDGFSGTAPVGCYGSNAWGLHDMIGNVWEWTNSDWRSGDLQAAGEAPSAVIKGGSFLCSPNYCMRYRPEARQPQERGLGTNHTGFRIVKQSVTGR